MAEARIFLIEHKSVDGNGDPCVRVEVRVEFEPAAHPDNPSHEVAMHMVEAYARETGQFEHMVRESRSRIGDGPEFATYGALAANSPGAGMVYEAERIAADERAETFGPINDDLGDPNDVSDLFAEDGGPELVPCASPP